MRLSHPLPARYPTISARTISSASLIAPGTVTEGAGGDAAARGGVVSRPRPRSAFRHPGASERPDAGGAGVARYAGLYAARLAAYTALADAHVLMAPMLSHRYTLQGTACAMVRACALRSPSRSW